MRATPNQKMEVASSVQQKDKMAGGTPRNLCMSHSVGNGTWNGANFCRVGTGHFRSSGEQNWKSIFWGKHKIIAWSYSAYICGESVSKYSICVCGSKVNTRRNILYIVLSKRNIFTWIVRRALNAISDRSKTETSFDEQKITVKKVFTLSHQN